MSEQPVRAKVRGTLVRMLGYPEGYSEDNLSSANRAWIDHHESTLASSFDAQAKECERYKKALESSDRFIKVVAMLELKPDQRKAVRDQLTGIDRALHGERGTHE